MEKCYAATSGAGRLSLPGIILPMTHRLPVSADDSNDPLKRMRAHQIAEGLIEDAFEDATKLKAEIVTVEIAPQLYASICGIEANIGEAYSRSSGKERALRFEYALGEVRECMSWYKGAKPVLGEEITRDRRNRLEEIRRMLLAIIPRERGKTMK
jgi:four helix bundle protein